MKILKVFSLGLLLSVLTISTTGCSSKSIEERLGSLNGISNITKIENSKTDVFKSAISFTITQQIDWDNKTLGTFEQKAYLFYYSDSAITTYNCSGYNLDETSKYKDFDGSEISSRYKGNYVDIEYRFFNKSCPTDFDPLGTKYYNYLNSYQATKDFHHLVTTLDNVLKGKKVFTGGSKGGYTTETMAYYFPNDIDAFVSYVAPLCDGEQDPRFAKFVYEEIGDIAYGKEKAKTYRDIVKVFQTSALSEDLRYLISNKVVDKTVSSSDFTDDEFYDLMIFDWGIGEWQYYQNFDVLNGINKLPTSTSEEISKKVDAIAKVLLSSNQGAIFSKERNSLVQPYYVQAGLEMGNYKIDLNYLKNAGMNIKTSESRYDYLFKKTIYTDSQSKWVSYSPTMRQNLIDFFNTTTKDIIKIVGQSDPWYSVKAPTTTNTHVHLFEGPGNHMQSINYFEDAKKNECWGIIDNLVGFKSN